MTPGSFSTFEEFLASVRRAGFLPGALECEGEQFSVGGLCRDVRWHTGDPDRDPWEWRIRVLSDAEDIAYGKFFSGRSGYITREWFPRFIAVRRHAEPMDEAWSAGKISRPAKRIYDMLSEAPALAAHDIRSLGGFASEKKSVLERALVELQTKLYITVCGEACKLSAAGEPYGWPSAVFCTVENFFAGAEDEAGGIDPDIAAQEIAARVLEFAPGVSPRALKSLISRER